MMVLLVLVFVALGLTTAVALWVAIVDGDPMALVAAVFLIVLSCALLLIYKDNQNKLECETLVETMVTVGDVEICMPTSEAVDLVEVYQGD